MPDDPPHFLDTSVLIYGPTEGSKAERALALVESGGLISSQVLNEAAHVLRRKRELGWDVIADVLGLARHLLTVVPLTEAAHVRALAVARATGYSVWDASIVATAIEAGCSHPFSDSMQDGRRIDGLTIRNPFAPAPPA